MSYTQPVAVHPVRVYSKDAVTDIIKESKRIENSSPRSKLRSKSLNQTRPHTHTGIVKDGKVVDLATLRKEEGKERRLAKYWETVERQRKDAENRQRYLKEQNQEKKERKFQQMLETLDAEHALVDEVGHMLHLKSLSDRRRKEQLHKSWHKKVFRPIQGQIDKAVGARSCTEIQARRNKNMDEYLKVCNEKVGVFRDIIMEEDYNPLKERERTIKYNQKNIRDPCKQDLFKIQQENEMIDALNPSAEKITPQTRDMLNTLLWDKLEATPYARYGGVEMQVFKKPAQPIEGCPPRAFNSTTIHLDHYNMDSYDKNRRIVKDQFFRGGVRITDPERYIGKRLLDHI